MVRAWIVMMAMAMLLVGCSSSSAVADGREPDVDPAAEIETSGVSTSSAPIAAITTMAPIEPLGTVRVARPNWDASIVPNTIVMVLLEGLGYEVEDLSTMEGRSPDELYVGLAQGNADLTLDAWLPGHRVWFEGDVQGQPVGDFLMVIEPPLQPAGRLQGFLVTKSWAEAENITTLGQINDTPAFAAALDADGDGKGEIFGCPQDWTCDDIIRSFLYFNEWESLEQLTDAPTATDLAPYDAMFEDFLERVDRGEAAVAFTWAPTSYYAEAGIGEKTLWLSVTDEAADGGTRYLHDSPHERLPERLNPDGTAGFSDVPDENCTQGPDGCQLGFVGSDIHAVANAGWLDANPAAHALLEVVELDTVEMSGLLAELEQLELEEWSDQVGASIDIARRWIDANPDRVGAWLAAAR